MRKAYLDYRTAKTHGERFKIQYDMYGDMLLQNRFPLEVGLTDPALDTRFIEDQSREELALAAEVTATYQFSAAHSLLFGTKYVHTIAGPNRGFRFDTETNLPTTPAPDEEQVPVVDIPSGKDNNVSAYAKIGSVQRPQDRRLRRHPADHDDWREKRTVFLPAAGHHPLLFPDPDRRSTSSTPAICGRTRPTRSPAASSTARPPRRSRT
jgi:hypothetical protein